MLDVDGVLVNGRPRDGKPLFTDLERDLGVPVDRLQAEFFETHWEAIVVGREDLALSLKAVLARIAPHASVEALITYWLANDARIDTHLLADVDALRAGGVTVLLATNQEHLRARFLMEDLGLGAHVDGIVYSAALGHRKPEPEFYRLATQRAGVSPGEIVLIDDNSGNVGAARAAGWQAAVWTGQRRLAEVLAGLTGAGR
jgi:putative hydrolase of the HAD superfamily